MSAHERKSQEFSTESASVPDEFVALQTLADRFVAVLVVGHGTRNPAGAAQLMELVKHMRHQSPYVTIEGCFLELAEPTIGQAIESLHVRGIKSILVVPVLLFTAAHAKEDIPDAVKSSADALQVQVIGQTESLGTHASVLELSLDRFREVTSLQRGERCPRHACARVQCDPGHCLASGINVGRIGLAMIGRGTSDKTALAHMRLFTEKCVADRSVTHYQTGFFAGGTPSVDVLLEETSGWDCDTVIVQPHLLFEGDLVVQLREKVLAMQRLHPNRQWLITRTLGADPKLATVFLRLVRERMLTTDLS